MAMSSTASPVSKTMRHGVPVLPPLPGKGKFHHDPTQVKNYARKQKVSAEAGKPTTRPEVLLPEYSGSPNPRLLTQHHSVNPNVSQETRMCYSPSNEIPPDYPMDEEVYAEPMTEYYQLDDRFLATSSNTENRIVQSMEEMKYSTSKLAVHKYMNPTEGPEHSSSDNDEVFLPDPPPEAYSFATDDTTNGENAASVYSDASNRHGPSQDRQQLNHGESGSFDSTQNPITLIL